MNQQDALTHVEVIREHLLGNLGLYQGLKKEISVFPVLKSNAYGHDIEAVARLLKKTNIPYFAVQTTQEARQAYRVSGIRSIVMGPTTAREMEESSEFATFALSGWNQLQRLIESKQSIRAHLKVNTSMNRQGFEPEAIPEVLTNIKRHSNIEMEGVFSHFADADNPDPTFTKMQEKVFSDSLDLIHEHKFYPKWIHLGNSAGFLKTNDGRINAGRPGIGFYGYNPLLRDDPFFDVLTGLRPTLRLVSTVTNVHRLKPGDKVSYNGTFTVSEAMNVGVVPVGYFEALDRKLSNCGIFLHQKTGKAMPILGRVCMNLTCFGSKYSLQEGDRMILISANKSDPNSVQQIAEITGTIPYEVLTRIHSSLPRKIA